MFRFLIKSTMVLLVISLVCQPAILSAQIKSKPVDPATGEVQEPTPSFRNVYRRGEEQLVVPAPGIPDAIPGLPSALGGISSQKSEFGGTMDVRYQVHVLGEVNQPGTYRVNASERVSEVLQRAGGITQVGSERNIALRRHGGASRTVDLFRFKRMGQLKDNPFLLDNDVIYVPLASKIVQIVGAVRRPNYYELKGENSLNEVVKLAGGINISAAKEEPVRVIRYMNGKKNVLEVEMASSAMKDFAIQNGDVVVVPDVMFTEHQFDYNIRTLPGTQPFLPSFDDRVFVLGGIVRPGAYPFNPHYMLNQYLTLAGGVAEIGKEKYKVINLKGESRKASPTDRVNPGETIYVEKRLMRPIEWVTFSMGLASFGLSTTATILALTRR